MYRYRHNTIVDSIHFQRCRVFHLSKRGGDVEVHGGLYDLGSIDELHLVNIMRTVGSVVGHRVAEEDTVRDLSSKLISWIPS